MGPSLADLRESKSSWKNKFKSGSVKEVQLHEQILQTSTFVS